MYLVEKNERVTTNNIGKKSLSELEDEVLLARIDAGDQRAYTALVQRYVGKIWRLAMSILRNEQEAEDAVQDVFVSLLQSLKSWNPEGEAKFSTWIYRVSFNKCIDIKRKRRPTESADDMDMRCEEKNAYHETLDNQISARLSGHMGKLPDAQQDALRMFYFEELTVAEIAEHLGNTEQGVRSLLKRGKASLRDTMQYDSAFKSGKMTEVLTTAPA